MGIEKRNLRRRSDTKMETFGNLKAKKFTKTYFLKSVRQLCYGSTNKELAIGIATDRQNESSPFTTRYLTFCAAKGQLSQSHC